MTSCVYGFTWLRDLYRFVFGFYVEDALKGEDEKGGSWEVSMRRRLVQIVARKEITKVKKGEGLSAKGDTAEQSSSKLMMLRLLPSTWHPDGKPL